MKLIEKPLRKLSADLTLIQDRIEYLRCLLGWPLPAFCRMVGTQKSAYHRVVVDLKAPTTTLAENIAQITGCNKGWLFGNVGSPYGNRSYEAFKYGDDKKKGGDTGIGSRIKKVRIIHELTQPVFAAALQVPMDTIVKVEQGRTKPSVDLINSIIVKYKVRDPWILRNEGAMQA